VPPEKKPSKGRESKGKGKLTRKQLLFVEEYLIDLNATKAAERAGYAESGAYQEGHRLLKKAEIYEAVKRRLQENLKLIRLTQERILKEYEVIAFSRITTYLKVNCGRIKMVDTEDLPEGSEAAVESYSETTNQFGGSLTVKLHNKLKALDALSRYTKLFKEEEDDGREKTSDLERLRSTLQGGIRNTLSELRKGKKS
jgi:phage terminase small subunit